MLPYVFGARSPRSAAPQFVVRGLHFFLHGWPPGADNHATFMDHMLVPLRPRVLLADVHTSSDGKGIGYGMMLIRMRRAILVGQLMNAQVLFVRPRRSLNAAVMHLQRDDLGIIPPASWRARWLTCLWFMAAPLRAGAPWLWTQRSVARLALGPVYAAFERSTWLPRRVRRAVMRQEALLRRLKAVNAAYSARSDALWQTLYKRTALARLRDHEPSAAPPGAERFHFPPQREREIAREAERLGIRTDTPLVTVHVRESGYRSVADLRQRDWDTVRNARIDSYFKAISALVERGYTVVRLGDPTMTPVSLPGVVDLATSPARTASLEVWCTMRSTFLIGCDSGPSWLAVLLGVPVLTVNAVHFRDLERSCDRIICKRARDRSGRVLPVAEMLTEQFLREGFKGGQYEPIDNKPSEIRRAALDMVDVVHGREQRSSWQREFNRQLRNIERHSAVTWSALEGVAIMSRARGTLSRGFAKKYFRRASHDPAGGTP